MFSLRPARPADNLALAALYTERGHTCTPAAMTVRLSRVITDPAHAVIVAETTDEKRVVGAIHVALYRILEWDEAAQILGVIVAPSHQRRGLGRALTERAEQWARDRGCTMVYLRTNALRTDATSFYARLGYLNDRTQFFFTKKLSR
jgi:GNAT superfamily N-acetyltransferase